MEGTFLRASSFLLQRLGKGNTKRREMFKYLEMHHLKLVRNFDTPLNLEPPTVIVDDELTNVGPKPIEELRSGLSKNATTLNTQTTSSTFIENNKDMTINEI